MAAGISRYEKCRVPISIGNFRASALWTFVSLVVLLLFFPVPSCFAQSVEQKKVLLLSQEDLSWPIFRVIDENVRAALHSGLPGGVLIYSEHMDVFHFPDRVSQAQKKAWIQRKYANSKLDLIVGVGDVPTDIFPNVPLVYLSVQPQENPPIRVSAHKDAASVWAVLGAGKTVEFAQRLQPKLRQVAVIVGTSPTEGVLLDQVRQQLAHVSPQLQVTYLTNLQFSEILKRVGALNPESAVLFVAFTRDADGRPFIAAEAIRKIAAVSEAPVYAVFDAAIGSGAVGGYVTRFGEMGKQAGGIGLQFIAGEHPGDAMARNDYLLDWRQLQRWQIPESLLPAGTILINRQPTVWELYYRYILGAILALLVQTLLILGLLWQRARKKKFQKRLLDQIAFQRMLADLSTTFISLPEEQIGATIEKSLGRIANYLKLDRITLFEYLPGPAEFRVALFWRNDEVPPAPTVIQADNLPWTAKFLRHGEMVLIHGPEGFPEEAAAEKQQFEKYGVCSVAIIPMKAGDQMFGAISFATVNRRVSWTEELVGHVKLLAEIFSNALMRRVAQEAKFKHSAIVESSDDAIVYKNLDGTILSWNAGAERLFEFSEAEIVGQSITVIIPEELREEENRILQRLSAGERIEHYETVRVAKSGKKLDVSLTISPVRDSAGKVVAASKIARDITEKKRAEQALRKSEERFRLFMDHSPAVAWMKDELGRYIYLSESYLGQLGIRPEERLGKTDLEVYPSAVAEELRKNDQAALAGGYPIEVTEESIGLGGKPVTWLAYKFPFQDTSGRTFVAGIAIDITHRKKSEEILHNLTGRLISAQEEERARIARELHDDFSQRLALFGIGLGRLWNSLPPSEAEAREKILDMLKGAKEISSDLHSLSHQLHSSKLEHVGLGSALGGLCKEIGLKHEIDVRFAEIDVPSQIPKDVSLCLFRVAQEALNNVVKHSQSSSAQVELRGKTGSVTVRISDAGQGFDPCLENRSAGIGLAGMRERLRLVNGQLVVTSQPKRGTEILAEVPLASLEEVEKRKARGVAG